jgi:mitochondrial fission protein ELM1
MTTSHHKITYYSDNMCSIAGADGILIAVTTGPKAASNAQAFRDLLDLLRETEAAGITGVEKLFSLEAVELEAAE